MTWLFSITILLTVVALLGLFAMMGELSSKVDAISSSGGGNESVHSSWGFELEDWTSPRQPVDLPQELSSLEGQAASIILVLSTTCASCSTLVDQGLSALHRPAAKGLGVGIALATQGRSSAALWLADHEALIDQFPLFVDETGSWSRQYLGVDMSPSAVHVVDGFPVRAYTMSSADELVRILEEEGEDGKAAPAKQGRQVTYPLTK